VEILLNSLKNIHSVNVDNYNKVELSNKLALTHEYDINNVLSATEVFDAEREANEIYRIYGKIEYFSPLNGLKSTYSGFTDFFKPQSLNCKTIFNSFDFYLVKPASKEASSGYTRISGSTMPVYTPTVYTHVTGGTVDYIRTFEVIATQKDFEIYPAGFANNVYGDQVYAFNFNRDFDVSSYLDGFGFPLTELFLYAQYKPTGNGIAGQVEKLSGTTWSPTTDIVNRFELTPIVPTFNIGDILHSFSNKISDVIGYSAPQFYQTQQHPQTFYIETPYNQVLSITIPGFFGPPTTVTFITPKRLRWKYYPFIPFQLRYFSSELDKANTGSTVYATASAIPYYATKLDDKGNYAWRYIMPQGYSDPLTGIGVDYPFVNKRRYLFSNIIFDIAPDLNDNETRIAFEKSWYTQNATKVAITPISDLNNIGKPCR
jgi:hypothetical protein